MNVVELAYSKRPKSPSYWIHSDNDVNGSQKARDFIGDKYITLLTKRTSSRMH